MSELADFLTELLFWFWVIFITVGSIGGCVFIAFVVWRADAEERTANLHAREDIVRANPKGVFDIRV